MIPTTARVDKICIVFVIYYFCISFCLLICFFAPVKTYQLQFCERSSEHRKVDICHRVWPTSLFDKHFRQNVGSHIEIISSIQSVRNAGTYQGHDEGDANSKQPQVSLSQDNSENLHTVLLSLFLGWIMGFSGDDVVNSQVLCPTGRRVPMVIPSGHAYRLC